ncbi:E3 ubiquitin-protein ligase MIB2-like isoform X1 [Octopus vulgaris]|uniref:E3 ubiquitin-protein ligase MIB2-like isoform X1 n=1 Tax=Octopus vulgaris TaxID=6645 RepID=A0AA36F2S4_OCTVU|nr:E3 ubiquitin-protein ligase MIB2-like isoform X1 [Octopus vulgaris]
MDSIFDKIRNNDMEGLKTLLKVKPGEIHGRNWLGRMLACRNGADRRIIEILIEAGGEVGAKDLIGDTALHYAVYCDRHHAVEILLSRGSEVNARSNDGQTPLHRACWCGHLHTVDILLGHNGIDATVVNNDGDTPLHVAVWRRWYKVVCLMLNQGSVQLDIKNKKEMTPLLEAISLGYLGMTHKLIALGASINAVDGDGNSCLHIAVKTEVFNSEDAPMDLLNKCCTSFNLKMKERLSGVVVARYLASQGADFHHKNNKNNTPLDLIKDPNLRKKLEAFSQPQSRWCEENMATVRLQPCGDLVLCENCSSEMTFKRCPVCRDYTLSKREFEAPKFEDRCVQTEATCQELGAASQAIGAPKSEDRCVQTEATCQELEAASQAIARLIFEDKEVQTVEESRESPVLKERDLLRVAKRLGRDWWQVAIFLEVDTTELKIDDESIVTVKQGYLMLNEWFKNCDPETRTHATLSAALEEAECFTAMECLSLDAK